MKLIVLAMLLSVYRLHLPLMCSSFNLRCPIYEHCRIGIILLNSKTFSSLS